MSLLQSKWLRAASLAGFAFFLLHPAAHAAERIAIDDEVTIIAEGDDDEIVAIGGMVDISGHVTNELVAIGGSVRVDADVEDEAVIGGGEVTVSGTFAQELVMFGGMIEFSGATAETFVAMGGMIDILDGAVLGGTTSVYGGEMVLAGSFTGETDAAGGIIEVSGQFAGPTTISGENVTLSGSFSADLEVEGDRITLTDTAVIAGNLLIRSPNEPVIPDTLDLDATQYTYEYIEKYDPRIGNLRASEIIKILGAVAIGFIVFMLFFAGIAFVIVGASSRVTTDAAIAFKEQTFKSFLFGILAAIAVGIVGVVLSIIVIGILIPVIFGFIGFFIAAYAISALIFKKVGQPLDSGQRFGYILLGTLILAVISMVPVLGGIIAGIASTIGMGAFSLALFGQVERPVDEIGGGLQVEAFDDHHPPEPVFDDDLGEGDPDEDPKPDHRL